MSPGYTVATPSDDEPERYNEVLGSKPLADAFAERGGWLRGGLSINGKRFQNFEANSPEGLVAQLNARQAETGVYAELEDGKLKLSHASPAPIIIEAGAGYQPPNKPGEKPEAAAENTLLDDMGIAETPAEELPTTSPENGRVGQVGDGGVVQGGTGVAPSKGPFQTAEEIEQQNRAMMSNPRGISGGVAPYAPHETVPGTTTTGNRPQVEPPDSNARRVEVPPGQETALGSQPVRAGSSAATSGAAPQANQQQAGEQDDPEMSDAETETDPDYGSQTNEQLRQHARDNEINLGGASTKADIVRAIKKHDRKVAKEKEKASQT